MLRFYFTVRDSATETARMHALDLSGEEEAQRRAVCKLGEMGWEMMPVEKARFMAVDVYDRERKPLFCVRLEFSIYHYPTLTEQELAFQASESAEE